MADDKKAKQETLSQLERMKYYLSKVDRCYAAPKTRFKNQEIVDSIEKFDKLIDSIIEEKSSTKDPSPTQKKSPTKNKAIED